MPRVWPWGAISHDAVPTGEGCRVGPSPLQETCKEKVQNPRFLSLEGTPGGLSVLYPSFCFLSLPQQRVYRAGFKRWVCGV